MEIPFAMSKPRIALVIEGTYPWYRGGVSEWVARYLEAFTDFGFSLIQIATDPYLDAGLESALYGVPGHVTDFIRVEPPPAVGQGRMGAKQWMKGVWPSLAAVFQKAELIHVANTGFAGLLGARAADQLAKPLVLTEHALYWKEVEMGAVALECGYQVPDEEEQQRRMRDHFEQIAIDIYGAAREVISVSRCNMEEQRARGAGRRGRHRYIPNGVAKEWLESSPKYSEEPVIGWVGRCAAMKNPLRFLDFVEAWEARGYGGRFLMLISDAGEPRLKAAVTRRAARYSRLTLVCNQSSEKYYKRMDALCISSNNESQPLVLFEALAQRVLPFGWQAGDVTEAYGPVVGQQARPGELAARIHTLWQQPEVWRQRVEEGHRKVRSNHTWPAIFERYRQLLRPYLIRGGADG